MADAAADLVHNLVNYGASSVLLSLLAGTAIVFFSAVVLGCLLNRFIFFLTCVFFLSFIDIDIDIDIEILSLL